MGSTSLDKSIKIWNTASWKLECTITLPDEVWCLDVKQGYIFTIYKDSKSIQIYNLNKAVNNKNFTPVQIITNSNFADFCYIVEYHEPTKQLYVGGRNGK